MKPVRLLRSPRHEGRYLEAYDAVLRAWPVAYESRLVDTRFGRTHVLSCGPEEGPPLVLLHGAGLSATMWRPNVEALCEGRRVHAVDTLWDAGRGEPVAFPRDQAEAEAWFGELLDGLDLEGTDLSGLSYGGYQSLRFALAHPDRIRRLVVLAPAASLSDLSGKFFLNALGSVLVPGRPAGLCRAMIQWAAEKPIDEDLMAQWVALVRGMRVPSTLQKVPPLVLTDDELRGVRMPALLLMGDREWTCRDPRAGMERFLRLVPDAEAELIPDAGHIVSMDRSDLVTPRILEHLSR